MKDRYTLNMWMDDMGSFTQPGCTDAQDALWHVNRAREHDGLRTLGLSKFQDMLQSPGSNTARATLTIEN